MTRGSDYSSVCLVTRLCLDMQNIRKLTETRRIFLLQRRRAALCTPVTYLRVLAFFRRRQSSRNMKLTTHFCLLPRLSTGCAMSVNSRCVHSWHS